VISNDSMQTPIMNGLVLAGGHSKRMGADKGIIQWHGKEQRYYMADLLKEVCNDVYISCREEQRKEIDSAYNTLPDTVNGGGPLVGILSALKKEPDRAWLVVACDLPLLDLETVKFLIERRDVTAVATTFESPFDGLPEPLITIWEPASLPMLLTHLSDGFSCPRKALIRNMKQVKLLLPPQPDSLMNANTPDDAEKVKRLLADR